MTDFINKKVNFLHTKKSVKITKLIYSNGSSKVFQCIDFNNPSLTYCLKILSARNNDKQIINNINTEIIILVSILFLIIVGLKRKTKRCSDH
jgi:hypothetical protein